MGAANKDSADAQHAAGAWFEAAALEPLGNGHMPFGICSKIFGIGPMPFLPLSLCH